jgi:hypothetical protein
MATNQLIDVLPEAMTMDERVLNSRERELLSEVLRRVHANSDGPQDQTFEIVARAIGHALAERAGVVWGDDIARSVLLRETPRTFAPRSPSAPPPPIGPRPPSPAPPGSPIPGPRVFDAIQPPNGPNQGPRMSMHVEAGLKTRVPVTKKLEPLQS